MSQVSEVALNMIALALGLAALATFVMQRVQARRLRASAHVSGGAPAAGVKAPMRIATDIDFLPAALEIVETPPSPVGTTLMLGICSVFALALGWSYIGKLDVHAVALGKIQASGRTKVVQPLEAGRVVAIRVENGQSVREGDVLVELDPTDTKADLETLSRDFDSARAESKRRQTAVAIARSPDMALQPIPFADDTSVDVRIRETGLMAAEISQLRSAVEALKAQVEEKRALRQRLALSIEARRRVLELSKERVGMREEIKTKGAGSRALIIEAELQYENFVTTDASERGQQIEADAAATSLERKVAQAIEQFVAEQTQKQVEAERKRDKLEQDIIKARSKSDRTQLRSPIAGTVQQLEVTTLGQVIASGQAILSVVPNDAPLEVEAMVANKDIGFVHQGQHAVVKVEAFPFTRYGTIDAEVTKVSTDAVEDRNATGMMDAASASRPQANSVPKASPGQNLVFPAVLKIDRRKMQIDGREVPLSPGMTVIVEIKTGERRAISYLLSPLGEVLSNSVRER